MYINANDIKDGALVYYIQASDTFNNTPVVKNGKFPKRSWRAPQYYLAGMRVVGLPHIEGNLIHFQARHLADRNESEPFNWQAPLSDGYAEFHYPSEEAAKAQLSITLNSGQRHERYGALMERETHVAVYYPDLKEKDCVWVINHKNLEVEPWTFMFEHFFPSDEDRQAVSLYRPRQDIHSAESTLDVYDKRNFPINREGRLEGAYLRKEVAEAHLATIKRYVASLQKDTPAQQLVA